MMQKSNIPQSNVPPEVKAAMWEFFLKTSVPRLIAKHEKHYKEAVDAKTEC